MSELLTTSDTFYHGKVIIQQPKKGYRFAVDSPILAHFLPRSTRPALEVGCGVGVVSLLALRQKKFPAITGIEIQEALFRLAVENAATNGMAVRFQVIHGDFTRIHAGIANVQTIFCNPPFFKTGQGHVSPDPTIRLARFEIAIDLPGLLRGCAAALAQRGKLFLIFPYARQKELLAAAWPSACTPPGSGPCSPLPTRRPTASWCSCKNQKPGAATRNHWSFSGARGSTRMRCSASWRVSRRGSLFNLTCAAG